MKIEVAGKGQARLKNHFQAQNLNCLQHLNQQLSNLHPHNGPLMKVFYLLDKPVSSEWSLSSTPHTACELLLKAVYVQVTPPDQMGTSDSK
jgi:hypothetical protein